MQYHHYAEFVAMIAGIVTYRRWWPVAFKLLLALTILTFLVEISGHLMWKIYRLYNNWLYNLFLPVQCFLFIRFFYLISVHEKVKKAGRGLLWAMLPLMLAAYGFQPLFYTLNSYAATGYLLLMLTSSCLFYVDVIINGSTVSMVQQPAFWVAAGLMFFTVVFILLFALWAANVMIPNYGLVLKYVIITANTLLYGGLTVAFLCQTKTMPYSLRFL